MTALNPFQHALYASETKKYATDIIELGNTGIKVSRLAMGTGTHGVNKSSNQTRKLGVKGLGELLHAAFDQGIFFWDSADQYGTHPHLKEGVYFWDSADQYGTHPHLKEALKSIPREKVVILTKTHATTEEEMKADLDRFRQEIGTDYLDIVLLHFMTKDNWPEIKTGAMNVLSQAREDGIIKAHGVSCHTLGALKAAAATDWVQVDLARINPYGSQMDDEVPVVVDVLKDMKKKGKTVMGMKIFGAGALTDRLDECLQYALGQNFVDCFTIGQEDRVQMQDLIKRIPAASIRG